MVNCSVINLYKICIKLKDKSLKDVGKGNVCVCELGRGAAYTIVTFY